MKYFPQKLSVRDAIEIREDTLQDVSPASDLYPFVILQKIMAFDSKCRIVLENGMPEYYEVDSDSDSSEGVNEDSVHPMDGLLALIHCSDNFLRQDLFSRLATCQIAVPLLLPHPDTRDPTLLMWALRAIVKEFKLPNEKTYSGRIITYPAPFVSFLRIGSTNTSKSAIMNGVMNVDSDCKTITPFYDYDAPGGDISRHLVEGLVEMSWYLPGDGLFPMPIAFTNLRGDASDPELQKQVMFLRRLSFINVILLSSGALEEECTREPSTNVLHNLLEAPGGMIVLQAKGVKGLKTQLKESIGETSKCIFVKHEKNFSSFVERLQNTLRSKLLEVTSKQISIVSTARMCNIPIDEDDADCVKGKQLMEELYAVVDDYRGRHPQRSPKDLLPLQSENLLGKWAELEKVQYRQRNKFQHKKSIGSEESLAVQYGEEIREKMERIRKGQSEKVNEGKVMPLFIKGLRQDKNVQLYCITWLRFALDDMSRKLLPPFYAKIHQKRHELFVIQKHNKELSDVGKKPNEDAEKVCQQELKELDRQLVNASFGFEHLMREMGQMYEAVTAQGCDIDVTELSMVSDLPKIAAQVIYDGYSLELLDGDASHLPRKWINAVLKSLQYLLNKTHGFDPKVCVLSVLGLQSAGNSTLLNTVFGVEFSVSAGRCTRGAFMQLIPVHPSLYENTGVHYFLVVDTEGLRAPELDRLEVLEHDNELATFVIGIANLTLINVCGELAGDIDDVLNASVHTFLRMSEVRLSPSCYIIHQNVGAFGAGEKLMQARLKTMDKLDETTRAAAKETGLEGKYTQFSDIIRFDHLKDVSEFVGLWNGELPMASVSPGYSRRAQELKLTIINKSSTCKHHQFSVLNRHLEKLWEAILQEDFVCTFQNTFEIVAYKSLEVKYSDIFSEFTREMSDLKQKGENELFGCMPDDLDAVLTHHQEVLHTQGWKMYRKYQRKMTTIFEDDKIMLKWQQDMELKLRSLYDKQKESAKENYQQVYHARKDRTEAEKEREREVLSSKLLRRVQRFVETLGDRNLSPEHVIGYFQQTWSEWMKGINMKPLKSPDVEYEVEHCVFSFFSKQSQEKYVREQLIGSGKRLREFGRSLEMELKEYHIQHSFSRAVDFAFESWGYVSGNRQNPPIEGATKRTFATFSTIKSNLMEKRQSGRNFQPKFVNEILFIIRQGRKEAKEIKFTDEYEVDRALIACGYAIRVFKEMQENYRKNNDPQYYVENEMKPHFQTMFINMYDKVQYEKIAAATLCGTLKNHIKVLLIKRLTSRIHAEMRDCCPWIKDKQSFIAKILLEIGKRLNQRSHDGLDLCIRFLTNARASLEFWAKYFTEQYCHSGDPSHIYEMVQHELKMIIHFLVEKAANASHSFSPSQIVTIDAWLKQFHADVMNTMGLSLANLRMYFNTDEELPHLHFFTEQVKEQLDKLHGELKTEYKGIRYSDTLKGESAHEMILKQVAGCTEQCPFCKAQCELTISGHDTSIAKHTTQHRPECLGGHWWHHGNKLLLDICTYSVATYATFRYSDTNEKPHPYKDYRSLYPDWHIPADQSFQASLFWKWFIGHYSTEIEKYFKYAKTDIPREWRALQWRQVEELLKWNYQLL